MFEIRTVQTSRLPISRSRRAVLGMLLGGSLLTSSACKSSTQMTHDGVRLEIEGNRRWHRIENTSDSFHFDSPELSVSVSNGQLSINSESAGPVRPGDHLHITSIGTVLVNGERRGDKETGREALQERLKVARAVMESHKAAVERVQTADHEKAISSGQR